MQKVVVVIPTFNRSAHIAQTISDLLSQSGLNAALEIVVVNDGSTDGTEEMLTSKFPSVHIVNGSGEWWYTRSMNEGFETAYELSPDFILTMNDDVRLPKNYVSSLLQAYDREEAECVMGSISVTMSSPQRITFSGVKSIAWWRYKYTHHLPHYSQVNLDELTGVRSSKVLPGRGMLIPVELLKKLNGFDASLVQYGSDDDFCLRAAQQGANIKVSYDAVVHSYDTMTGVGNPSRKDSLMDVVRGFGNKYSTLYLPKSIKAMFRHGNRIMLPVTVLIVVAGSIWANMKFKKA
jgi:GT2 family glycosyltransferase